MPSEPFIISVVRNALFVAGLVVLGGCANAAPVVLKFEVFRVGASLPQSTVLKVFMRISKYQLDSFFGLRVSTASDWRALQSLLTRAAAAVTLILFSSTLLPAQSGEIWQQLSPPSSPNATISDSRMVYDFIKKETILVLDGFEIYPKEHLEVWTWNGTTWNQQTTEHRPPPRSSFSLAYDETRQQVVLFGGLDVVSSKAYNDTWVWDGNDWHEVGLGNTPRPLPRFSSAMVYDAARKNIVLFGGLPYGTTAFNDTWIWNGASWSLFPTPPASTPYEREGHSMVFDRARNEVLMFGSVLTEDPYLWVWNGSGWSERIVSGPSARTQAGLAYDSSRSITVMFGGNPLTGNVAYANDTWIWDGEGWTELHLDTSPSPRAVEAMSFDVTSGQTVLFGGNGFAQGSSDDTWIFGSPALQMPKPVVLIVPGIGASTLTDTAKNDQWLSCSSISSLHNGLLNPLQYDIHGNPATPLIPREILTQSDSVSAAVKPSTESIVQCSTTDLIDDLVCAVANPLECLEAKLDSRTDLQNRIATASAGALLQFNSLISALQNNGYDPQAWPYDFRRDISALGDDLYDEVQHVALAFPGRPLAVLAHSMGNLVTAAMLAQHPDVYNAGPLSNVISMGAPFNGAIDTYLYAQGWRSFLPEFLSAPNSGALGQNWTSVYQLLPQWQFVSPFSLLPTPLPSIYQVFSGEADPIHFPALPRSTIVPELTNPQSVWGEINDLGEKPFWSAIIGYGQSTAGQIVQVFGPDYSKPCYQLQQSDGDGTVPLTSSRGGSIVEAGNRVYVKEQHQRLPQNDAVIHGILNILNGASPFTVPGLLSEGELPAFSSQDTIFINACSPVALTITDSAGEIVSSQFSQIPNAKYANIGDATQVELPWNDAFQVQVMGTGTGAFDLVVNALGGQHSPLSYFFKAVPVLNGSQGTLMVGGTSVPALQYNYAGKNIIDSIPANATPPTILCTGCYFITQNLRATFAFNVGYQGGVSTFSYNFRSRSQAVQFVSSVTAQISITGTTAGFSGQGSLNGQPGYSFTVTATDGGAPGSGLDSVSIQITGPNNYLYNASGAVAGGDVIVHQ